MHSTLHTYIVHSICNVTICAMHQLTPNHFFAIGSSNSSDLVTRDTVALTVGICYFCVGIIFIILQLICAYLIQIDEHMQNPTYKLVVNLSIADALELMTLGMYAGLTLIIGVQNPTVDRWMAFISTSAWYANCFLFVFIAFSRWVIICRSHLVDHLLRKNVMRIFYAVTWVPMTILCFYGCVLHDPAEFGFNARLFTWSFEHVTKFGLAWHWINFIFNTVTAIIETTLSVTALCYVNKTRKLAERSFSISGTRRRETKLLIQCFILGCFFTATSIVFVLARALGWRSTAALVAVQGTWIFNHCVNPLVYLSVNTRLRKKFIRFILCRQFRSTSDKSRRAQGST